MPTKFKLTQTVENYFFEREALDASEVDSEEVTTAIMRTVVRAEKSSYSGTLNGKEMARRSFYYALSALYLVDQYIIDRMRDR